MNDHMKKPEIIAAMVCAVAVLLPWVTAGDTSLSGLKILQDSEESVKYAFALPLLGGIATGVLAYMEKIKEMDIAKLVAGGRAVLSFIVTNNEKGEADFGMGAYLGLLAGAAVIGIFAKAKMDEKNNG